MSLPTWKPRKKDYDLQPTLNINFKIFLFYFSLVIYLDSLFFFHSTQKVLCISKKSPRA